MLLVLSFPRFSIFPLAWVALVPWLVVLPRLSFKRALLSSVTFGFVFFAGLLYWIALFGYLPWVLLALVQGLFVTAAGICIWLYRRLSTTGRMISSAATWTVFEWLRGFGPYGFTWGWLGYSQSPWIDLIQIVCITGVPGLSFLILLHNAAVAGFFVPSSGGMRRRLTPLISVWVIILALTLFGRFGPINPKWSKTALKVAILQPSPREPREEDVGRFWTEEEVALQQENLEGLTREAAALHPELIIWPESALPAVLNTSEPLKTWAAEIARKGEAGLLLGAAHEDEAENTHNSAYLLSPEGEFLDRYDKVQLVPFGEFVPGRNWLPGLQYYPIRGYDLTPGEGFHKLRLYPWLDLGVSICFESIFPHIFRHSLPDLWVIITNDGWFKRTAAPAQHRQAAVFRAVETRRWVLRAASTGISCVISPRGEITKELELYQRGVLEEEVKVQEDVTLYHRFGDWFVVLAAALTLGCLAQTLRKAQSSRKTESV